jgi:hypothetical protein
VAISAAEERLGEVRVRACAAQAERLLVWAAAWPERTLARSAVAVRATANQLHHAELPRRSERTLADPPTWRPGPTTG